MKICSLCLRKEAFEHECYKLLSTYRERDGGYEVKIRESRKAWVALCVGFEQKKDVFLLLT